MELRKIAETEKTITFGWQPVQCEGYLFFADDKRVSKTFDPTRSSIKFSKGPKKFRIEAVNFVTVDQDEWPNPATPQPPAYKKVAPITVTQQGGSNQRVCLFEGGVEGGPLRPGVRPIPGTNKFTDDSGAEYESNGLENSSIRTVLPEGAYGLVKAREMDGRNACQCPTSGDPTKNTGSWTV